MYVASSCSFVNQWTVAAGGDVVRLRLHHTILYASSAWWGFAGASDRQRLAAFIRRSDRSRFVPTNLPAFADLCHDADEKCLQPSPATVITYYITSRRHSPLVHKTTTCGNEHTILPSSLDLAISLTITLSNACYISTYTRILRCTLTY